MAKSKGDKEILLYGRHPVTMALQNPRRQIREILAVKGAVDGLSVPPKIPVRIVGREQIEALVGREAVHQGLVARCMPSAGVRLDDILTELGETAAGVVLLLDQVTDPHNIGAILRSAAAFGALAVIVPEAGAPDETGVLAKSASGALEVVPLVRVANLARAMARLKEAGFWCIGMDGHATGVIGDQKLPARAAFVMGSEGDGMRRLTAESCDFVTKLPMSPAIESLNVSNAAAITLYEYRRQYPFGTRKG